MANWKEKLGAGVVGTLGGIGGFMVGGPWGAVAGAGAGASAGEWITGGGGDFWDTHIGREGLIGGIGDVTGLWESGTTADKRRKALDANTGYIEDLKGKKENVMPEMMSNFNAQNTLSNIGGLFAGLEGMGNLATDNSRGITIQNATTKGIQNMNLKFDNETKKAQNVMDSYDDRIYGAEQQRRDLT